MMTQLSNNRLAIFGYVVLAVAAGLFLEHVFLAIFGNFGVTQPLTRPLWGDWTWSTILGLGLAFATAIYLWIAPKTNTTSMEIVAELRKVSWPSFPEARAATVAVIVASIISAVLLGLFDLLWQTVTNWIENPTL
jgi:preprotein translocase subunit SecE